jgi:hypothetical protein
LPGREHLHGSVVGVQHFAGANVLVQRRRRSGPANTETVLMCVP